MIPSLFTAQIMPFAKLRQVLSPKHDSTLILKYLQQVATLLQGNWIVNSELIYPKDTQSGTMELMYIARDYIVSVYCESIGFNSYGLQYCLFCSLHKRF